MIEKAEVTCLKLLRKGPFFDEYLACINLEEGKTFKFTLRAMEKPLITLNKNDEDIVMFEAMIRTYIRHPFLINQICAFQDYDILYYATEYAPVLLLNSEILPKKFSVEITKFYAAEAFTCLRYLHSRNQNYTFISSENVFLAPDGHIKLDYSFCNCLERGTNGMLDYLEYLSPDYIDHHRFNYISDYWSLGLFIYRMTHGFLPFSGDCKELLIADIKKCSPIIEDLVKEDIEDILKMLLDSKIAEKYPSCEALESAIMEHSFFSGIDWEKIENKECEPPFQIKLPEYDLRQSPKLSTLYTSEFIVKGKDGYGNTFTRYNTVHFLKKNRFIHDSR